MSCSLSQPYKPRQKRNETHAGGDIKVAFGWIRTVSLSVFIKFKRLHQAECCCRGTLNLGVSADITLVIDALMRTPTATA